MRFFGKGPIPAERHRNKLRECPDSTVSLETWVALACVPITTAAIPFLGSYLMSALLSTGKTDKVSDGEF